MLTCASPSLITATNTTSAFPLLSAESSTTNVPALSPVYAYCARCGLSPFLKQSIDFARNIFTIVGEITLRFEVDPEVGDEYIRIDVPASGTADEIVEGLKRHTRLTRSFPDYARSRLRIAIDPI